MARKVIIDCDPGIDDAVALTMALFDPRIEVLAITATAGTVDAEQSTSNVHSIIQQLDPPKHPRIGSASPCEGAPVVDDAVLHGRGGLGECKFDTSAHHNRHSSEKIISELLRQHPGEITLVCLGPLSNVARVFRREPGVEQMVDRLVISGGAFAHGGNVTPTAEQNIYYDPASARSAINSATTKSLVPLDVTEHVNFSVELLDQLPARYTRAGQFLQNILPFVFRTYHQRLGRETIPLYDPVALMAVLEPDLFNWVDMAIDVETRGELTRGQTVCDRRSQQQWTCNAEVASRVDEAAVIEQIVRGIRYAGQCT